MNVHTSQSPRNFFWLGYNSTHSSHIKRVGMEDDSPWSSLHAAIRLARVREQMQRGRTDVFINFITVGMGSSLRVKKAKEYCKSLDISTFTSISGDALEIHMLPNELIEGIETAIV